MVIGRWGHLSLSLHLAGRHMVEELKLCDYQRVSMTIDEGYERP